MAKEERDTPDRESRYTIHATSPPADDRTRVLKSEDTFAVFDHYGDIHDTGLGEQGLYHEGTRYLSRCRLLLDGHRPLMLGSNVRQNNSSLAVDLTNSDWYQDGELVLARETLHILRCCFLWQGACYTRLLVKNFGQTATDVRLTLDFEADFADIFEVRGMHREERGRLLDPVVTADAVTLAYAGRDGVTRRARLGFTPRPTQLSSARASFQATIGPREERAYEFTIACQGETDARVWPYERAQQGAIGAIQSSIDANPHVYTSNEQFNQWWNRSEADLHMLVTQTAHGPYPYAGVPWFSTAFGRDGIIAALQHLWLNPSLARGVLGYLAASQADKVEPERDAEPGKILHETRRGEMAALGEIPFSLYYGSADATPLFIMLAAAYYRRTGDRAFIEDLWPHVERALGWIDDYGDVDGDGFFEYARQSANGLVTQGWKDSWDSVFHADGTLAEPPIALCEIQAYIYAARRAAAELAAVLGHLERARELERSAADLQRRFESAFWVEELSTYALALDAAKRPCRVRTSNAGHCLFAGIASPERAGRTAGTLLAEGSFSGWGIRTVATTEARYNPMSYHNGSIWPHDNALIAQGLADYGLTSQVIKVFAGLFDASMFVELQRMPELLCGFARRPDAGPTSYPVACAPQAWAAGGVFMMLQACLGLAIDAPRQRIEFRRPALPKWLPRVTIDNLRVGDATVDLRLERHRRDVGINLARRDGDVEVRVLK
jgi:glycogen debranching enzyme